MSMMRRVKRGISKEGGFTITEVLIAGLILVIGILPMFALFDTSFKTVFFSERRERLERCSKLLEERIRAIPFYVPHTTSDEMVLKDLDDHFWGQRDPIWSNPSAPSGKEDEVLDWGDIPEIPYTIYQPMPSEYGSFSAFVQMGYVTENISVASLKEDWEPSKSGRDRPIQRDTGTPIDVALIRLSVVSPGGEKVISSFLVSSYQGLYNLGITSVEVLQPDSVRDPSKPNSASHWPNENTRVRIRGWGFRAEGPNEDLAKAYLVRDKYKDIEMTVISRTENELLCDVDLYSKSTESSNPWRPRAAVGPWSVKVKQDKVVSVYLFQGMEVTYPFPRIDDFGAGNERRKVFYNTEGKLKLYIDGGPFCFPFSGEIPSVAVVRVDENGREEQVQSLEVTSVTDSSNHNGYSSGTCLIEANFTPSSLLPGDYYLKVANTRFDERGHRASRATSPLTVTEVVSVPPQVTDVLVYGEEEQRYGFWNVGNPYRLVFKGQFFNVFGNPPSRIWLCSSVDNDGNPSGNWVEGEYIEGSDKHIVGRFNLSSLPPGSYRALVRNLDTGLSGWSDPVFEVRTLIPYIDSFVPQEGYGFWENWYDIPASVYGFGMQYVAWAGLVRGGTEYKLVKGEDFFVVNPFHIDIPQLNLIGCASGEWRLRLYYSNDFYVEKAFTVTIGAVEVASPVDSSWGVQIYTRRRPLMEDNINTETPTTLAWAWWGRKFGGVWFDGYAVFRLRGKGFVSGTTRIRVYEPGILDISGTGVSLYLNRDQKIVQIETQEWKMPRTSSSSKPKCDLEVTNPGVSSKTYPDRWELHY